MMALRSSELSANKGSIRPAQTANLRFRGRHLRRVNWLGYLPVVTARYSPVNKKLAISGISVRRSARPGIHEKTDADVEEGLSRVAGARVLVGARSCSPVAFPGAQALHPLEQIVLP
jgi:hypothetical protein